MSITGNTPILIVQLFNDIITKKDGTVVTNSPYNDKNHSENKFENDEKKDRQEATIFSINEWSKWKNIKAIDPLPLGVPIPIPLLQRTGLIAVKHTRNIVANSEYQLGALNQNLKSNTLAIDLISENNSILSTLLLGLFEVLAPNIKSYAYEIAYFNSSFVITKAHLGAFTINDNQEHTLLNTHIELDTGLTIRDIAIEKTKKDKEKKGAIVPYDGSREKSSLGKGVAK
jgi:hypothetical protein